MNQAAWSSFGLARVDKDAPFVADTPLVEDHAFFHIGGHLFASSATF
jgi:hypothetical protein